MSVPNDALFEVSKSLDEVRNILTEIGLRPYRVFWCVETFDGARRGEGNLLSTVFTALSPRPRVQPFSPARVASSGGLIQEGSVLLRGISRSGYTREQILGRLANGNDRPRNESFFYALHPVGQLLAELYVPATDPVLDPFGWSLRLNPVNRRITAPA